MMSPLDELYEQSKQLFELLQNDFPREDQEQDEFVTRIEHLIGERQRSLEAVLRRTELKDAERSLLEEVLKMDQAVNVKMLSLKNQFGEELGKIRRKKQQGMKYEKMYNQSPLDGMFFDKRGV